jgi:sulfur-oxidizing protein SoxY
MTIRLSAALALGLALALPAAAEAPRNPLQDGETWAELRGDVVGDRALRDGTGLIAFDAPYRAHDAAIVPIEIRETEDSDLDIRRLILVVDENPAPVAAEFEFGERMGELDLATRVRVNAYSNVRAIAETADGTLYQVGRYVKASGGCSAPALKDADAAMAALGRMKMRLFEAAGQETAPLAEGRAEAQVMIRHPNYSGLQMNQVTRLYIPAHFVSEVEVRAGEDLVFRMTGGISISEDPSFRFRFDADGTEALDVRATDTEGEVFEQSFPVSRGQAS